jgi:FHS family L-fucose permease-like MFS transporter
VAAQTGINSFFINYAVETKELQLNELQAGLLLGLGSMTLFAVGRFAGGMVMRKVKAELLLGSFAIINSLLMLFVIMNHNRFGIIALISCYLFMSIMFPSIFALGLRGLGDKTKTASSILVLTIVGGAIAPVLMGFIGESNMNLGFIVPLVCFLYISFYGFVGSKAK